ncbi:MAG: MBL fold metallo-hydrolase [Dehalococcoidia bacterium]|nr:MBL fold metallo-hydrolase [Dehalococcoidia bacterium]
MEIKLGFLGAARNVTGSCYLLETNGSRILIDCGMFQEWKLKGRNWESFPVPPSSIDAVLLTHVHLDHSGRLPLLVKEGFKGKIYCTPATRELAKIVLLDSAKIQEEDAAYKKKRHEREGKKAKYPEVPLYTTADVEDCLPLFSSVKYDAPFSLGKGIDAVFCDVGHILGSAMVKVCISQGSEQRTIMFSGDVGRWDQPILEDPTLFNQADYVLVEATYGNRLHDSSGNILNELAEVINQTYKNGGNVIIPSFAIERSQVILYHLNELLLQRRIPHLMTFVDSPMAVKVTEVFENHEELFDKKTLEYIHAGKSPFDFPGLVMVKSVEQSMAINHIKGTSIIIAGSGMITGGRIKHHLVANITRPESTIVFVGYQAAGTLGREILDGAKKVRILGQIYPVKAKVVQVSGLSAHADRDDLVRWLSGLKKPPRHVFVTHGDADVVQEFGEFLKEKTGWNVMVPEYQQEVILD